MVASLLIKKMKPNKKGGGDLFRLKRQKLGFAFKTWNFRLRIIGEGFEFAASAWMFEFPKGLSFDLPDPFTGDFELLPDFF